MTPTVVAFAPLHKNSLRGFVSVAIPELFLEIRDLMVHEIGGKRWVGLPARPLIGADGELVRNDRGKIAYAAVLAFTDATVRDEFSRRVIEELLIFAPAAFERESV